MVLVTKCTVHYVAALRAHAWAEGLPLQACMRGYTRQPSSLALPCHQLLDLL